MDIWLFGPLAFIGSLALSLFFGVKLIPILRKLKYGQHILKIGPKWHSNKSGTPTMGGLIFIMSTLIASLILCGISPYVYCAFFCGLGLSVIGFLDDITKIKNKQNKGLLSWQKFSLQIIVCIVFIIMAQHFGLIDNSIKIIFTDNYLDLGWFYMPFAVFVLVGANNAINLTDGLDGLATSTTIIISIFFAIVSYMYHLTAITVLLLGLVGGLLGFLNFNMKPAKIFMGDTGSLFLGGIIPAVAILIKNPLILAISGGIFVIETLSVIIQVVSFKLTKRRVFKMTPIHHHFEMCGWHENRIVTMFTLVTVVLCVIAYFI